MEGYVTDGQTIITKEEKIAAINEWNEMIVFISDWDSGKFIMTQNDYLNQPHVLKQCIRMYREFRAEQKKDADAKQQRS